LICVDLSKPTVIRQEYALIQTLILRLSLSFTFSTNLLHRSSIVVPSIPIWTKNERSLVEYLFLVTGLFIANKKS
jgi:hypothetical protein